MLAVMLPLARKINEKCENKRFSMVISRGC